MEEVDSDDTNLANEFGLETIEDSDGSEGTNLADQFDLQLIDLEEQLVPKKIDPTIQFDSQGIDSISINKAKEKTVRRYVHYTRPLV